MNEEILKYIVAIVLAYIYGAIPFSLIVGLLVYKTDIREIGSGNVGGTNLSRVGGKTGFALGFILDLSKGSFAVLLGYMLGVHPIILLFFALLGHSFSIFIKFKGGKGVATSFGFVLAYTPIGALIAITAFIIILVISKYVSLSSIIAIFVYVVYALLDPNLDLLYVLLAVIVWLAVTFMHRKNIVRIFNGTESKIGSSKK